MTADYRLEETVYLKHSDDPTHRYLITAVQHSSGGSVLYRLTRGRTDSWHYASELSDTPNFTGEED
jgi:hypothetical protein